MYSFGFPDMVSSASSNLVENHGATKSNLMLLLASWKKSLFGDPYFGTNIKRMIYDQGDEILKDLVIDDIYTSIAIFMPQIFLRRSDIDVYIEKDEVFCTISCINKLDSVNDLFTIQLTNDESV
nr:MAG TPA: secretion system protein [Caudoviricetes sp.]